MLQNTGEHWFNTVLHGMCVEYLVSGMVFWGDCCCVFEETPESTPPPAY